MFEEKWIVYVHSGTCCDALSYSREKRLLTLSRPCVRPHGATLLPRDWFSLCFMLGKLKFVENNKVFLKSDKYCISDTLVEDWSRFYFNVMFCPCLLPPNSNLHLYVYSPKRQEQHHDAVIVILYKFLATSGRCTMQFVQLHFKGCYMCAVTNTHSSDSTLI